MTVATMDEAVRETARAARLRRAAAAVRAWGDELRGDDDDRLLDEDAEEEDQDDGQLAA